MRALELGAKAISGLRRDASADGRPGRRDTTKPTTGYTPIVSDAT